MALNRVILIGRLVRDVEVKTFGEGVKLASFTLAVDRRFKGKDKNQPSADFIPVSVWRKSAEFAEKYFSKGKQVYVSGALETYSYESEGRTMHGFRINADEIGFADSIKSDNAPAKETDSNTYEADEFSDFADAFDDDLPFDLG